MSPSLFSRETRLWGQGTTGENSMTGAVEGAMPPADDLLAAVRTEFRSLPLRELLNQPPRVLLGVTAAAAKALKKLEVESVFDLATSGVFDDATKLMNAGATLNSALYQHGAPT